MSSKQTPQDGAIYDEKTHQWIAVTPSVAAATPDKPAEPAPAPAVLTKEK
ncbi:MAG: hypothetical protein HYY97_15840 [Rhodocyclales bacterium]|nr:hypothetical protein [Rhodocyclales bacterium]